MKPILLTAALAVLAMGPAQAQERGQAWRDTGTDRLGTLDRAETVSNVNRASKVLGMQVRNDRNQNLGRVEDIVFDLRGGRVAYAVLAVPDFDGEKLVAVPPAAFSFAGPDSSRLMLHVDRAQLERAPALAQGGWPNVERPFASFDWLMGGQERDRFSGDQRVGEDRFYSDRSDRRDPVEQGRFTAQDRLDQTDRFDYDQGLAPGYQDATGTGRLDDPGDRRFDRDTFRGTIVAVNPEARTMTVEDQRGQVRHFVFAERTNLQLKDNRYPRIIDLKVGFPVSVGFQESPDGRAVANTVIRTDTPEVK